MKMRSPSHSRPPPELPEDLIAEILFLLPPDDPKSIFRASRVCRAWRRVLTDPAFCHRYREFHRTPPLLGFVGGKWDSHTHDAVTGFFPTTAFRPRCPEFGDLLELDARHGRVIFRPRHGDGFVIWDPVTGGQCRVPEPPSCSAIINYDVAVLCAADGCDHLHCHGGPSLVALVGVIHGNEGAAIACLYSTEAGAWSDTTSIEHGGDVDEIRMLSRVLVRNALYFVCHWSLTILRYDLVSRELSVINPPKENVHGIILMMAEDGMLVRARVQEYWLQLYGQARPVPTELWHGCKEDSSISSRSSPIWPSTIHPLLLGFDVIFLTVFDALLTIELSSGKLNEVYDGDGVIPYLSFYTLDPAAGRVSPPPLQS